MPELTRSSVLGVLGVLGVLAIAGMLLVLAGGCARTPGPLEFQGPTMGTTYTVLVPRLPDGIERAAVEAAIASVLRDADEHLSGWNDASELARINADAGSDWLEVSPILFAALREASTVSAASGGAFDVTVGPLVRAWGFGAGAMADPPPPSPEEIARLLARVGHSRLELRESPPGLRKGVPGLSLDLDGIAPGWAVDRIAERLDGLGIGDYLVELGGEVRARGQSRDGRRWRIAVETPVAGERRAQAILELDGLAVSTSGDYRDYREIDGRRISHTIDPRTGMPVSHGLASVTVVSDSAAGADAWATALMVLGPHEGMALARRLGLAALFIERGPRPGTFVESETPQFGQLRLPRGTQL